MKPTSPHRSPRLRRGGAALAGAIALAAAAGVGLWIWSSIPPTPTGDRGGPAEVERGRQVYAQYCAACHGAKLEGQPAWQRRKPDGRLPAPPHDASGHTWHHPDDQLFGIIKRGIAPFAPPDYQSDMPAYAETLSDDEIWAVLAFIKSAWPADIQARQAEITRLAREARTRPSGG